MIRTINHTGRIRLPHSCINIRLIPGNGKPSRFRASLNLDHELIPGDANVFVEAYYGESVMRFDFGTVEVPSQGAHGEHSLEDIYSDIVRFRVKVVDQTAEVGRLIAICDRITPSISENRNVFKTSLLWVKFEELNQQVWKPELSDDMPVLCINESIRSETPINELVRNDPSFLALVFPAMVRRVLQFIIFDIKDIAEENPDDWKNRWIRFASTLFKPPMDPSDLLNEEHLDDIENWIDNVVQAFCELYSAKSKFEAILR